MHPIEISLGLNISAKQYVISNNSLKSNLLLADHELNFSSN